MEWLVKFFSLLRFPKSDLNAVLALAMVLRALGRAQQNLPRLILERMELMTKAAEQIRSDRKETWIPDPREEENERIYAKMQEAWKGLHYWLNSFIVVPEEMGGEAMEQAIEMYNHVFSTGMEFVKLDAKLLYEMGLGRIEIIEDRFLPIIDSLGGHRQYKVVRSMNVKLGKHLGWLDPLPVEERVPLGKNQMLGLQDYVMDYVLAVACYGYVNPEFADTATTLIKPFIDLALAPPKKRKSEDDGANGDGSSNGNPTGGDGSGNGSGDAGPSDGSGDEGPTDDGEETSREEEAQARQAADHAGVNAADSVDTKGGGHSKAKGRSDTEAHGQDDAGATAPSNGDAKAKPNGEAKAPTNVGKAKPNGHTKAKPNGGARVKLKIGGKAKLKGRGGKAKSNGGRSAKAANGNGKSNGVGAGPQGQNGERAPAQAGPSASGCDEASGPTEATPPKESSSSV